MQPSNREDYLAEQSRELDVWNRKIEELETELKARPKPSELLNERVHEVGDQRNRVVERLGELSQLSVDEWKSHREPVEAAWEDLRAAWNRVVILVGKSEERV
jgi:hypothetical protein